MKTKIMRDGKTKNKISKTKNITIAFVLLFLIWGARITAADISSLPSKFFKNFTFRNLGPYRTGAWITDFAVPESPPLAHLYTFYVATRHGGVWKTTNNGTTFEPIFDEVGPLPIGDIAVAPSNPNIIWVGTGEQANARSSHAGNGVYRSLDGGRTWEHLGLEETHHIARIIIHPQNPDLVYVAAMGHLFTSNPERGVYKTEDGGKSWQKVLYVNENVGAIDLVINRQNPNILYAAMYEKYRYPWHFEAGGPGSGIYKTTDGGRTWRRLTGGLPTGKIGRIGLDIFQKNPSILYAVIENVNLRPPTDEEARWDRERGLNPQPRPIGGEIYRSEDGGETWLKMNSPQDNIGGKAAYSFNQIRIDPSNDQRLFVTGICLASSEDGGRTWHDVDWPPRKRFRNAFGDVRALWIDPQNPQRMLFGSDGGVYQTYDGGKTCDFYDNLPISEIYAVGVDNEIPYNIYVGLQDHESWKGPSNSWSGQVTISDWKTIGAQDGMYNVVDITDSRWLYNTFQFGGHHRVDQKLGLRTPIIPRRGENKAPYRFNWTPPLLISPHNPMIIYTGAQVLLRSLDRGDHWQEISPDLTTNDQEKIAGQGHITYCTITTISESPLQPGLIWVGTDDGLVWVTTDGGANWKEVTSNLVQAGAPHDYWVSRVVASAHDKKIAYVLKSGFRRDDFRVFVYRTEDLGQTWQALGSNLPPGPANALVESDKNPSLLFLGTDSGLYLSLNRGQSWTKIKANMPKFPIVSDLIIHPREKDLIVATYGRGVYLTNIAPLEELTSDIIDQEIYFFSIQPEYQLMAHTFGGNYHLQGNRHLSTPNEPNALSFWYYLKEKIPGKVKFQVKTLEGEIIWEGEGPAEAGLHRVLWNMRQRSDSQTRGWFRREMVEPGTYLVIMEAGGKTFKRKASIRGRVSWQVGPVTHILKWTDQH
ncbi:MAG: hypothetical protein DRJ11_03330 [Candidatus Aminicenantes bacterium]|nr:MAG: hypothetical protein DRJ11_03330 [Candidatus Aminicenantes bacterium]